MDDTQQLVIFEGEAGQVEVRLEGETVWLSLQQLADLFGRDKSVISRHLKGIFSTDELTREGTVAKNATVQLEGSREVVRHIEYYNLDAIISVGYRVNSTRATRFRQWATTVLREHLTDGYPYALPQGCQRAAAVRRHAARHAESLTGHGWRSRRTGRHPNTVHAARHERNCTRHSQLHCPQRHIRSGASRLASPAR